MITQLFYGTNFFGYEVCQAMWTIYLCHIRTPTTREKPIRIGFLDLRVLLQIMLVSAIAHALRLGHLGHIISLRVSYCMLVCVSVSLDVSRLIEQSVTS